MAKNKIKYCKKSLSNLSLMILIGRFLEDFTQTFDVLLCHLQRFVLGELFARIQIGKDGAQLKYNKFV